MDYQSYYRKSIEEPEAFWGEEAEKLQWYKFPNQILQHEGNEWNWFADGEMNTCYMAVDYHVENGRGDQVAIYYDSPVSDTKSQITFSELRDQVARFAGALKARGVEKGDTVVIYMPMVPEVLVAMLACARLGAIHSVVFGGFASHELAIRINDAKPKLLLTSSCGIEIGKVIAYQPLVDAAIEEADHKPDAVVVLHRPQAEFQMKEGRDLDWYGFQEGVEPADPVPVKATDPLYILYTSGTTGQPKGVVRQNGGHAVAMRFSMEYIYDVKPGEVFWAASDVGWVVGHSYIVYAPLLHGCSTIVYEGKPVRTPDAGGFWRVMEEYKVSAFFTAPTAFRAVKKEDPNGELLKKYDLSSVRAIYQAGERLDPPTYEWLSDLLKNRFWITGGRRKPAGASQPTRRVSSRSRSRVALRHSLFPATSSMFSMRRVMYWGRMSRGHWQSSCRCRRAVLIRCGTTMSVLLRPTWILTPATTCVVMTAISMKMVMSLSWAVSMMLSTSPATGSQPVKWKRLLQVMTRLPSAPSWVSMTS